MCRVTFAGLCLLSLTTTALAGSIVLNGCASLKFESNPCFMSDVEILPAIHISNGILSDVQSAEECQSRCQNSYTCSYFTFREDKSSSTKTCHLKPSPSLASSPIMTIRKFDSNSKFTYTSGPKECGQKCEESKEVIAGCGGATPATCALLDDAAFDAACAIDPTGNCGKFGYKCCRDCSKPGNCCKTRVSGYVLSGGTSFESQWNGVVSAEQCQTLCVGTSGCTHWNFITSETTSFLGGACYLKTYEVLNKPEMVEASSSLTSVIGSVDCSRDFGIRDPATTPSPTSEPGVTGAPVPGTCFGQGIDVVEGHLFTKWGIYTPQLCQELCQKWPGCRGFVFNQADTFCGLKYTLVGKSAATEDHSSYIFGPRDCPNEAAKPPVDGCVTGDTDIEAGNVKEEPVEHAADCGRRCMWDDRCQGWSYVNKMCYMKAGATPTVAAPGVASGTRGCVWPEYARRLSQAGDLFPSLLTSESCAMIDMDYYGADIESVGGVDSVEQCRYICLGRSDCKSLSYVIADQVCKIKYGGELVAKAGVISMPRSCPCEGSTCARVLENVDVAAANGLAEKTLGNPSSWIVKGEMVNFAAPSGWQRLAILLLTDDVKEDCYISDLIKADHNCWDRRQSYLPLRLRAQIIGVGEGHHFAGWNNISWDKQTTVGEGHMELFNEDINILEAEKPNSDHGLFILPVAGHPLSTAWPVDMKSPVNFENGHFYARMQSLYSPEPISFKVMFCITASDYPVSEACTAPMVVPPFDM